MTTSAGEVEPDESANTTAEALQRAEQSERMYRYLAEHTADVVVIHDKEFVLRYVSPNAPAFFGYTPEEARGLDRTLRHMHIDDERSYAAALAACTPEHPTVRLRVRMILKDGTYRWVSLHTKAAFAGGEIDEYQSSLRGIQQAVEDENRLRVSNRQLLAEQVRRNELLSGIIHDLSAPLAAIRLTSESLQEQITQQIPLQQLEVLIEAAHYAETFVSDLRSLAEPDGAEHALSLERHNMAAVVSEALTTISAAEHAFIEQSLFDVEVLLDVHACTRIVMNLISNAITHAPQAKIRVSVRSDGNRAVLVVEDGGPGIAAEDRERVLRPFQSIRSEGSGLGLAIVQSLVRAHGGTISLGASRLGGLKVSMQLPVVL